MEDVCTFPRNKRLPNSVEVKDGTYQDGVPWLLAEVGAENLIAAVMTDDVDNEVQNEVRLCY